MKFNCGKTLDDKVIILSDKRRAREEYLSNWHSFFAIIPRQVASGDCRVFETIERKGTRRGHLYCDDYWDWEYRPKQK